MNGEFCIAAHALVYLHHRGGWLSSQELAKNLCTHAVQVRKVLSQLKKAGWVESQEGGCSGGYRFRGQPEKISLAAVAEALDTRCVRMNWHTGNLDQDCLIASGMGGLMDALAEDLDRQCRLRLAQITIADLEQALFHPDAPNTPFTLIF